jgi:DUF971 family protein
MLRALEIQRLPQALKFRWSDQTQTEIPLGWLRSHCTCAVCLERPVDQFPLFSSKSALDSAFTPQAMMAIGNYGFEVVWSDKHRSIYDFVRIKTSFENLSLPPHLQSLSPSIKEGTA